MFFFFCGEGQFFKGGPKPPPPPQKKKKQKVEGVDTLYKENFSAARSRASFQSHKFKVTNAFNRLWKHFM